MCPQLLDHLPCFVQVIAFQVGVEAEEPDTTEDFAIAPGAVGQFMLQAQLAVQGPVQVVLEQVEGLAVLSLQHRLGEQPVQLGALPHPATDQAARRCGMALHLWQLRVFAGLHRLQGAVGALQIGGQQAIQFAHHDQAHVVGGVPILAHLLQPGQGQVTDFGSLGALEPQFHRQLVAGLVAQVLAVEPALQVRVMAAVLTLHHALGAGQGLVVQASVGQ